MHSSFKLGKDFFLLKTEFEFLKTAKNLNFLNPVTNLNF